MKITGAYTKDTYIKFEMSLEQARSLLTVLDKARIDLDNDDLNYIYLDKEFYPTLNEAVTDLEKIEGDENGP